MNDYLKQVGAQATAIMLAAAGAALLAFFQTAATASGVCEPSQVAPQEAGLLGALFKGVHSALSMKVTS